MAEEKMIIKIHKSTLKWLAITIIAFFVGYLIGNNFTFVYKGNIEAKPSENPPQKEENKAGNTNIKVSPDDDPSIGSDNAELLMIEFSDFQCPFCKRFRDTTFEQIKKEYIDTGKVKFVYRDFPLDGIHPLARKAAEAANCALEQGKFWEYHDELFRTQNVWSASNDVNEFKRIARNLGLDSSKFDSCLDSGKYANEVQKDLQDGISYGVTGTPAFFIGNDKIGFVLVPGAQPYSVFKQVIDQLLQQSG